MYKRQIFQGVQDVASALRKLRAFGLLPDDEGWRKLQSSIRGMGHEIDIEAWRSAVRCVADDDVEEVAKIEILFWNVVSELTIEDRRKLLAFWGVPVLPAAGFGALDVDLDLRIQKVEGEALLPTAGTCFGLLRIPATQDVQQMRDLVAVAVEHHSEFGVA